MSLSRRKARAAFAPYQPGDMIIGPMDHPQFGPGHAQGVVTTILEAPRAAGQRWWVLAWRPIDAFAYSGPSIRAVVDALGVSESGLTRPGILDTADPELADVVQP